MLFEAWTANPYMGAPFDGHPFNRLNNINGVDGDPEAPPIPAELNPDGDRTTFPGCETLTIHTLADPKILAYEKAYVKKVVETLNDLDNVLYEICNEALRRSNPASTKLIVAQRIASVRRADRIVVLEGGRIAACGTHSELLSTCAVYQDIYRSQIGEEESA